MKKHTKTYKVALTGMLFALAIVLSIAESFITPALGLPPGVKLGLANIVVMYALLFLSKTQALVLVVLKGGFALTRGFIAAVLSTTGGLLSFVIMLLLLMLPKKPSMLIVSVMGAIGHNLGQMLALRLLVGPFTFYYFPVLLVSGVVMGVITSLTLKVIIPPLEKAGLMSAAKKREEQDDEV